MTNLAPEESDDEIEEFETEEEIKEKHELPSCQIQTVKVGEWNSSLSRSEEWKEETKKEYIEWISRREKTDIERRRQEFLDYLAEKQMKMIDMQEECGEDICTDQLEEKEEATKTNKKKNKIPTKTKKKTEQTKKEAPTAPKNIKRGMVLKKMSGEDATSSKMFDI